MWLSITFSVTVSYKEWKGTMFQTIETIGAPENVYLKVQGGCAKPCKSGLY